MFYTFWDCSALEKIEILRINADCCFLSPFGYCEALKDIIIEGTIGQDGFDIHWSNNLTKNSLTEIMVALSTETEGLTVTLPEAAVKREFAHSGETDNGDVSPEFSLLWGERSNWNVVLA